MTRQLEKTPLSTGVEREGKVEGKAVSNILLDTGCSRTLVRGDLVPDDKVIDGEVVAIRCAHGDTVLYPLAEVTAVSNTLPMAVLLGTDTPELGELLQGKSTAASFKDDALVATRAMTKRQKADKEARQKKQDESGVKPKSIQELDTPPEEPEDDSEDIQPIWMSEIDDSLIKNSREKRRPTRQEKRAARAKHCRENKERHILDMTSQEFKTLQQSDPTLQTVLQAAKGHPSKAGVGFVET